jgi:hypothetical protein
MIRLGLAGTISLSDEQLAVLSGKEVLRITGRYKPGDTYPSGKNHMELPVFEDPCQLIAGSDALVFAGDPSDEFEFIVASLKESRHILIPNPVFLSREKVDYLFKLAEEANVAMKFRQPIHYHPAIREIKELLHRPEYVEIKRRINLPGEGSAIKEKMTNSLTECIDASLLFNNANLKKHKIIHLPLSAEEPEMIQIRLELDNACIINIQLDRFPGEEIFETTYYQNGIEVRADLLHHQIDIIRTDQPGKKSLSIGKGDASDGLVAEILQFISIIRSECYRRQPGTDRLISFLISNSTWHQSNYSLIT